MMRSEAMLTSMLVRVAASVNALSVCESEGSTAFNCEAVSIETIFLVAFFSPFVAATTDRFRSFPRIAGVSSSHSISSSSLEESFGGGSAGGGTNGRCDDSGGGEEGRGGIDGDGGGGGSAGGWGW
jgi:hypothetical protein